MTAHPAEKYKNHLRRQLGFLERSCASFDAGFRDEAMRIATVLRVLIHDTASSTSLLKHLAALKISLLSTCPDMDAQFADLSQYPQCTFRGMGITRLVAGKGAELCPGLGDKPTKDLVQVAKWWNQIIWVFDPATKITRRSVTLAAANKDGGAHVDSTLTPEYEALRADGAAGMYCAKTGDQESHGALRDAHLISLRQMGYEILNSPDLLKLCS